YGDADFTVSATASSGLTVTFGATGDCTVTGNTVHITGAGSCTITAYQLGNNNYNPATSVDQTFAIAKADQAALVLSVPVSITYGSTGTATTTGGSGTGAVTFSAGASTGCAVVASTGVISVSNASGTCAISASKAGDNNYNGPVTDGPDSVTLNKANQTITFGSLADKTYGDADFTVGATASSGLTVTFGATGDCTVTGNTVHITGAGSCTITAYQ